MQEHGTSPLDGLTAAERRVVAIVGRGATSKRAARELAVSIKTIEFHLGNVYRKLQVGTRAELANLVGREEADRCGGGGNLPVARTSLVGRQADLAALQTLIRTRWLVTVVGTGGVGKSRLSLQIAADAADRHRDGAWLIDLSDVRSGRDVVATTASALRVRMEGRPSSDSIAAALGRQRRLVVVDGCEHVLDAIAEVLDAIGRRCPHVTVLATSRERLDLDGEQVYALSPLSLEPGPSGLSPAAELFCARAQLADWWFEAGAASVGIIEDVCRRLDGLPLAIELAGSRAGALGLAEVAMELVAPLDVLRRPRGATSRQLSLRATVDWSYSQLEPTERTLFDHLSILVGPFDIETASAAAPPTLDCEEIDRLLNTLVRRSLLERDAERFRMLDVLRTFGAERLARHDRSTVVRRRVMEHFAGRAEALDRLVRSPAELAGHHAFERDWHHIREAVRTAIELGELDAARRLVVASAWWAHSRARLETGEWATSVLAATAGTLDAQRPALLMIACAFQFLRGDLVGLTDLVADARSEVERVGITGEPWIPYVEAHFTTLDGETRTAAYRELRRWTQQASDPFWSSIADGLLSDGLAIAIDTGALAEHDVPRALDRITATRIAAERNGPNGRAARARYSEGIALRNRDPDAAARSLQHALELANELDLTELGGVAAGALAVHLTRHDQPRAAAAVLAAAMDTARRVGAFGTLQVVSLRAPITLLALGRPYAAATVLATLRAVRAGDPSIDDPMDKEYSIPALAAHVRDAIGDGALRTLLATTPPLDVNDMTLFVLNELHDLLAGGDHRPRDQSR
jgi:predicted ATPase/DNA-binding CsgD family transcriptional regulator